MQVFAIVVSLAITASRWRCSQERSRTIVSVVKTGQPVVGRTTPRRPRGDHAQGDARSHPDAAVDPRRHPALVRLRRLRLPVLHPGHRFRSAVRRRLRIATHRALVRLRVGDRAHHLADAPVDPGADRYPLMQLPTGPMARYSRFSGSRMWQAYFVEAVIVGIGLCILTLRGAEYALDGDADLDATTP